MPPDAALPTPAFVKNYIVKCAVATSCTVPTPTASAGHLLLVTMTYNPQTIRAAAVVDDRDRAFTSVIAPTSWAAGAGNFRSEMWWAHSQGGGSVTVRLSAAPTNLLLVYVDEFIATSLDQATGATGTLAAAGSFSSGIRTTAFSPELVFGHGEGAGPIVTAGAGFTTRDSQFDNIEQTKLVDTPGAYEARFGLSQAGAWMAMMATLR